jgi:splicing factor 3A subunit 3
MDSVVEVQRQTHEEIERFETALATILSYPQSTHEGRLQVEHKASQLLDRITARSTTLSSLYADEAARKAELDALSAKAGNQEDLAEFYTRLGKVQEHYNKYPDSVTGGFELELAAFLDEPEQDADEEFEIEDREYPEIGCLSSPNELIAISLLFSGEEGYGKYLDLYANHTAYNNMKNVDKRLGYLQYLDTLLAVEHGLVHSSLPKEVKKGRDYEE